MAQVHHPDDRSLRMLFQHQRVVADFLGALVHEPWVEELDLNTLEQLPTNYVSGLLAGQYEERANDLVWKVRWRDHAKALYVIILLEFQSTSDSVMALRILVYVALFYQRLIKDDPTLLADGAKLPPVCPIVFYNGDERWGAALEIADLIEPVSPSLAHHVPRLRYCLIDEKRLSLAELEGAENVAAAICRIERDQGPEELAKTIGELVAWLQAPERRPLRSDLITWLTKVVMPAKLGGEPFPEVAELDEFKTVLEGKMQTWTERWYNQGHAAGLAEGEARGETRGEARGEARGQAQGLLWLLQYKFGEIDPKIQGRVLAADTETILRWRERLSTAASAEELTAG